MGLAPVLVGTLALVRRRSSGPAFAAVEIAAGVLAMARPKLGGYALAAVAGASAVEGIVARGAWDLAARDIGLAAGGVALARLAARDEEEEDEV
jgi:hypothetical protein